MDELLINRRYWYYRVRCPRQPAATAARRHFLRHKSLLPATPLDIQLRPELHTGGIVMKLCTVEDFFFLGGGGIQFVAQIRMCVSTGGGKGSFPLCMLLTQTRTVTAKPLLSMSLKVACVHQDLGGLWCVRLLFFCLFPFLFSQSVPKPIALEPCFGNKAAVLSIFVRLPRGTGGIPPPGQSGKTPSLAFFPLLSISV